MKIKEIPIEEITPYERNPRQNAKTVSQIKKSLKAYGQVNPIILNNENVIICGHARYKAFVEMGIKKVQVIIVNLSEEKAREYRIIDNKIQEVTKWDNHKLLSEIREFEDKRKVDDFFPEMKKFLNFKAPSEKDNQTVGGADFSQQEKDRMLGKAEDRKSRFQEIQCPKCGKKFTVMLKKKLA